MICFSVKNLYVAQRIASTNLYLQLVPPSPLTARRLLASLAFVLLPREIQRVLKPSDVVVLARITERQMDSGSWPAQIRPPPCFCRE